MAALQKRIASTETFTIADNNDLSTNITIQTIILQENDLPDIVEYTELKLAPLPVRKQSVDVFIDYKQADIIQINQNASKYEINVQPSVLVEQEEEHSSLDNSISSVRSFDTVKEVRKVKKKPVRKQSVDVFIDYKQADIIQIYQNESEYEISIQPPVLAEQVEEEASLDNSISSVRSSDTVEEVRKVKQGSVAVSQTLAACVEGLQNCGDVVEWKVSGRGKKVCVNVKLDNKSNNKGEKRNRSAPVRKGSGLMRKRFGKKSFTKKRRNEGMND